MDYIIALAALGAWYHAYTYAAWLKKQGNRSGALGALGLGLAAFGLAVYRIIFT
ncbi:hypothetical protein SCACP_33280 [Sporomusa carbonis]|uniref:hypothetical protein n=1 Tax=Sporomusa carbonis TaxID=3076075 RepID=UPI003A79123B